MTESPAARRHRFAYAMRQLSSVDAAAQLLEAFERECVQTPPVADALAEADVPWELAEIESLPNWEYRTLLAHAVERRPAPTHRRDGHAAATMRADDLLDCRRYDLIGLLALAAEQAFALGDKRACVAMSKLCQSAVVQVIGVATMRLAFGANEEVTGDA